MTETTLKTRIQQDVIAAMRAQEKDRLTTLRMLQAAIKQREVDERITLTDVDVLQVLDKMLKQRRESAAQYETGQRPELAQKEHSEIATLSEYLPQALTNDEIDSAIATAIQQANAQQVNDMGKVMGILKPLLQGRADLSAVSAKVRTLLSA